jgi:TDG/mug DNA glycosylase family protein
MLDIAGRRAPGAHCVQADLGALPFGRERLGGAWASKSYVHLARTTVPLALADLHRSLVVDAPVELVLFEGDVEHGPWPGDEFAGRLFSLWPEDLLKTVVDGAGFAVERWERSSGTYSRQLRLRLRRLRTLPDTVGAGMRALVVGLNPSLYSADAGAGFARPGNRFWPAALESGLVTVARDPRAALVRDRVGMTDLVKRATRAASELDRSEYDAGVARLTRLVAWLQPAVVCIVGLAGWRAAVDRTARPGPQPVDLGGRPVYLMPNTSGLNASSRPDDFVDHFRAALRLGDETPPQTAR